MAKPKNRIKIANRIKNKSIEAYTLCLEIYNKPTIQYRIEASSYFICNAWELLLKAYYISQNGEKSIYRPDGKYTFSLEEMLNRCFELNSPIRKNLMFIIDNIRNKSTHLIIPEHDYIYTPFLQKAVLNYSQFIFDKFGINIAELVPFEYLSLIARKELKPKTISKLYSKNYADLFEADYRFVCETMHNTSTEDDAIFAQIDYKFTFTKDLKSADIKAFYSKGNDAVGLKEVTVAKDINTTHPHSMKGVIKKIKQIATEQKLPYNLEKLNTARLGDFNKFHNITKKPEYFNSFNYSKNVVKTYSDAYIEFILERLKDNPELFANKKVSDDNK